MKAFNLILNNTFLNQELEKNSYYFRIEFQHIFNLKKAMSVEEFSEHMNMLFSETIDCFNLITKNFENAKIDFVQDEAPQVWENNSKDLVLSTKGIFNNVNNLNETIEKINEIKLKLLKDGIFLKVVNYINEV